MGISPRIALIAGIADLQTSEGIITDSHWDKSKEQNWWLEEEIPLPALSEELTNNYLTIGELTNKNSLMALDLIYHNTEYGCPNVIGYEIDGTYANTWFYALASIYPEFQEAGWKYVPSIPLEMDSSLVATLLKYKNAERPITETAKIETKRKQLLIDNGCNYTFFELTINTYMATAHYLLNWMGLKVEESEPKLILNWYWG